MVSVQSLTAFLEIPVQMPQAGPVNGHSDNTWVPPALLDPLERALCSFCPVEYRMMDKVQKPSYLVRTSSLCLTFGWLLGYYRSFFINYCS
jgi:hypothetical protein